MSQCLMATVNDVFDPNCDPNNPRTVSIDECKNALSLIRDGIAVTPCTVCSLSFNNLLFIAKKKMNIFSYFCRNRYFLTLWE